MKELRDLIKRLLDRVEALVEVLAKDFWDSFNNDVLPEITDFISNNMDLAIKVLKEVAIDLSDEVGSIKAGEAGDRLMNALKDEVPNLESNNWWINLLIETAYAILKSRGDL